MGKIKTALKLLSSPRQMVQPMTKYGLMNWMSDKMFVEQVFRASFGYKLDLNKPRTFNEKLQWLKLHYRREDYTQMVDKLKVRDFVKEKIGSGYLIDLLGVWDNADAIDFDTLPNEFVLKCNHDQGSVRICTDKKSFNTAAAREYLNERLRKNHYSVIREWPYKNVEPRIIAEHRLPSVNGDIPDYKIHCFNGKPEFILVCQNRFEASGMTEDFFSCEWEHLPIRREKHPNSNSEIAKPSQLKAMVSLTQKLCKGFPFIRVDFYISESKIYFGELTFYPASGFARFVPHEWDEKFGDMLILPEAIS